MSKFKKSHCLPVLYVKGTHYEVGYQMGKTFKNKIQDYVNGYPVLNEKLLEVYKTEQGKKAYEDGFEAVKETFPQYLDELRGIADGSGVPFYKLFLLHDIEAMCKTGRIKKSNLLEGIGCTSVLLNLSNCAYLGHNEDADKELIDHVYIIHAHITSESSDTEDERFSAYCYAGDVPGFCMGYNHHGFVFSINVLYPTTTIPGEISPHFYCRALLSARNIEDAIDILENKGQGCSDGFGVNMAYIGKSKIQMCNVEVAPFPKGKKPIVHIHVVPEGEYYIHCNKYLSITIPEDADIASSLHRHAAISKLKPPTDLKSICQILGDESDSRYPVFRNDTDKDIATLGTGIFDLCNLMWSVYTDNPKSDQDPIKLPMTLYTSADEEDKRK